MYILHWYKRDTAPMTSSRAVHHRDVTGQWLDVTSARALSRAVTSLFVFFIFCRWLFFHTYILVIYTRLYTMKKELVLFFRAIDALPSEMIIIILYKSRCKSRAIFIYTSIWWVCVTTTTTRARICETAKIWCSHARVYRAIFGRSPLTWYGLRAPEKKL